MEWDLISEGYQGRLIDIGYDRRLKDARPKANSRGFLNPWNRNGFHHSQASAKTRNGNLSGDLKVPRHLISRLPDGFITVAFHIPRT